MFNKLRCWFNHHKGVICLSIIMGLIGGIIPIVQIHNWYGVEVGLALGSLIFILGVLIQIIIWDYC